MVDKHHITTSKTILIIFMQRKKNELKADQQISAFYCVLLPKAVITVGLRGVTVLSADNGVK